MKIAVVLSGCGVFDGSEINEVVLSLFELEKQSINYEVFAQDKNQKHVINHYNQSSDNFTRNILFESSRIVRGNIKKLSELNYNTFDGLLIPGGFGVAKNLSNLAFKNGHFTIDIEFKKIMTNFIGKPSGYLCIAPMLIPHVYRNAKCTIGNDPEMAKIINNLGGIHVNCSANDIVIDEKNRLITTPGYMMTNSRVEVHLGIEKLVSKLKNI
ncbi:isoprenoid biosynthesis glyoxalase ElbB [Candidatus Photodesmus anomalopis]|uniref:Enhancing lycopene biosynthesis protein 2 n=1 Tax=Candidatus Photodesmus katoptron Akat1 TaxID=1236703 RepID=S3DHM3_9GAMM|nr:isoprenoid biosynthesis glyoxalase ElbB [Candidatus Photodesmus katoptron]EPE37185.1 enhancing lycopene biosynthesis protein 2 [Candidatus Photodesmus katoptron Akat1]